LKTPKEKIKELIKIDDGLEMTLTNSAKSEDQNK